MSITLKHGGLPHGKKKRDIEQLAVDLGRELFQFSETTTQLLLHYIEKTSETDFLAGRICGMWEQLSTIADKFDISARALSYKERELEEAGLILRTGTPHTARTGRRASGGITFLAGINLAPFIERYADLEAMLATERQRKDRAPFLRQIISEKRVAIRSSGNTDLIALADAVSRSGRTRRITNLDRLEAMSAELDALLVQAGLPSGAKSTSDRSEPYFAPNKPCEANKKQNTIRAKLNCQENFVEAITPAAAIRLASPEFRALLDVIGEPSWPNLVETSCRIYPSINISRWVWGQACARLGREQAALCVLAIDRNHKLPPTHPFYCERPSGALFKISREVDVRKRLNWLLHEIQNYPEELGENVVPLSAHVSLRPEMSVHEVGALVPNILLRAQQNEMSEDQPC